MASSAASSSSSSSSSCRVPSWSALPRDVLMVIASLQTYFVDLFRFRSVCRSWRSAARAAAAQNLLPRLPFPFLMCSDEADPLTRLFYSLREGRLHRLRFPDDSRGWRCCGSSHGWLAILGAGTDAFLFNPISGTRAELPPLTTLPGVGPLEPEEATHSVGGGDFLLSTPLTTRGGRLSMATSAALVRDVYVEKAVLAMDPSSDTVPAAVLLLLHDLAGLVYARPGDEAWTVLPTPGVDSFKDVVYHGGIFYGLSYGHEMVFTIDLFTGDRPALRRFSPYSDCSFFGPSYLAVLPSGVILKARRSRSSSSSSSAGPRKTASFEVLRLKVEEPMKWVRVKALRAISLFLDAGCSAALYSSLVSGRCRGNCIYFASDDRRPGYVREECVWNDGDFGWFGLEGGAVERRFPGGAEAAMKHPVWVMLSI